MGLGLDLVTLSKLQAEVGPVRSGAKAKSVILVWLWGGPAHTDLFDPKPSAPTQFRGPFDPIATKIPGVRFTELLPRLAARNDKFALIRSLHSFHNDHGVAGTIGLTGSITGALGLGGAVNNGTSRPALGSLVSKASGTAALPGYLVVGVDCNRAKVIAGNPPPTLAPITIPFVWNTEAATRWRFPPLPWMDP